MLVSENLDKIADIVRQGGVIAYPTEAVFGLGCDPDNHEAIQRILDLKNRSIDKGLILISSQPAFVEKYIAPLSPEQQQLILTQQDVPTTWLVPSKEQTSRYLRGKFPTLAIRITHHQGCQQLCESMQAPLVSTSANPQGMEPARSVDELTRYFADRIDAVYDFPLGRYIQPSQLIDLHTQTVIRE